MLNNKQIYWEHGTLLEPQHFQILNLQLQKNIDSNYFPYHFGIKTLKIREEAFALNSFEILELDMLLPTGERVILNENAKLINRKFEKFLENDNDILTIWIGLPNFNFSGSNVTETDDMTLDISSRFIADLTPYTLLDLHSNGSRANIKLMDYNIKILFDDEPELQQMYVLPIARLRKNGNEVSLVKEYIPACLNVFEFDILREEFLSVRNLLLGRIAQLENYKLNPQETSSMPIDSQFITMLMFHSTLTRLCSSIEHVYELKNVHPWIVYGLFRSIIGELSLFYDGMSPLGMINNQQVIQSYDHYNLGACFNSARLVISRIINKFSLGPAFSLNFEFDNGLFICKIPEESKLLPHTYYLLIKNHENIAELKKNINLAKLTPKDIAQDLISKSLPGIHMAQINKLPPGILNREDTLYFVINQKDTLWEHAIEQNELALFLPINEGIDENSINVQLVLLT